MSLLTVHILKVYLANYWIDFFSQNGFEIKDFKSIDNSPFIEILEAMETYWPPEGHTEFT